MDGTIPRRCLAETLKTISDLSQKHGLAVANVFHAGDGNLHPLILYDANDSNAAKRAEDFGNDILAACIKAAARSPANTGSAWKNWMPCADNLIPPNWNSFIA